MRALFDTNVIIDIALERNPFVTDSLNLFDFFDSGLLIGYLTATTVTDIYYLCKKELGHEKSILFIKSLLSAFEILSVDRKVILNAIEQNTLDFEDSIQSSASQINGLEFIITRNPKDFKSSTVRVLSPQEAIKLLSK